MVSPINYMMNVRSPFEQAVRGFEFGQAGRLRETQEARAAEEFPLLMQQRQQTMDIQRAQEGRAAAQFEQQRQAAAAAQARAEAMQSQLMGLREMATSRTLTPEALDQFALSNATTFEEFRSAYDQMSEPRRRADAQFGIQLATSLLGGNPNVALDMIDERIAAAENSGDAQEVASLRANRALIEMDPQGQGVATLAVLASSGAIDSATMKAVLDAAGQGDEATEAVRTLKQRAGLAGLVEGTPEYNQFMISGGKTPEGMIIESDGAGGFRMVQGAGAANVKPFTEGQSKDVVYATRARGALEVLEPVAENLTSLGSRAAERDPTGVIRGAVQSPEYQVAKQAGDEFLQAILRKDTGAAITGAEQDLYGVTYLPQPGDRPAVLEAKRAARQRAVAAIEAGMSPAQIIAQEIALSRDQPSPPPSAPPPSAPPPAIPRSFSTSKSVIDAAAKAGVTVEEIWALMSPEQRARYGE